MLHNVTLPVDDPFWKKYFPPNGWNCRCTVVQVRKSKHPVSDSQWAIQQGEKATTAINKKGQNKLAIFRFNPGIEHKIFPPKHPYLPKPSQLGCNDCNLYKLDMNPDNKFCLACKSIGICEAKSGIQKKAKKKFIQWAKANHYDDYIFHHKEIGSAVLSNSSIRHILQYGETFYAKLDILSNIDTYLSDKMTLIDEPIEHDKDTIIDIKTAVVPYHGSIEKYKGENVEFTFRKMPDSNNYQIYSILIV